MAEHEWEKDEPVWWLPPFGEEWYAAVIVQPIGQARCAVLKTEGGPGFWGDYVDLRRRDPAMKGGDKPTAESEAER